MTGTPLQRLCAHRGVDMPRNGKVLDLAPVLGRRTADLLAIAGGEIPSAHMPVAPRAHHLIKTICIDVLSASKAEAMTAYARALPPAARPEGLNGLPAPNAVTFGAVLRRLMLLRNLDTRGMAHATEASYVTVGVVASDSRLSGRAQVQLLAAMLCLDADDLEAMTGRSANAPRWDQLPMRQALGMIPRLQAIGELILTLTLLQVEQIRSVVAFGEELPDS